MKEEEEEAKKEIESRSAAHMSSGGSRSNVSVVMLRKPLFASLSPSFFLRRVFLLGDREGRRKPGRGSVFKHFLGFHRGGDIREEKVALLSLSALIFGSRGS